jgi:hypothetical protein
MHQHDKAFFGQSVGKGASVVILLSKRVQAVVGGVAPSAIFSLPKYLKLPWSCSASISDRGSEALF